jgi:putative SOS response-associated peptidase YedK
MCGRYRLSRRKELIEEHFDAISGEEDWSPRYNIAPTQLVVVIRQSPKKSIRELSLMRWGLVPSQAKDLSGAARMINARAESVTENPAFREALKLRRCLLPADGFYEWTRTVRAKQPYCFEVKDGELFAFAGLWERWRDAGGKVLETCSILTTMPNVVTSTVPDRMPVILEPESSEIWLDPGMGDVGSVSEMLKPCDARLMRCFPVSSRINSVVHDDAACSARVEEMQNSLFS